MFELIMDDAWGIKDNSLPYGVFLTQFLIQRGVVIGEGRLSQRRRGGWTASPDTRPTRSEAPIEMGVPAVPPPWVAQLFADLDSRVGATVKTALQPLQEQVDKLSKDVQELQDDQEKLRTAFEGSAQLRTCATRRSWLI
ncbi:hypothetical protein CJ030_MR2G024568 [Morella rubra]|uniref:Uncharacterized protein n=1 Tax=Morella rubra TaxID=262757 RepID=A0A6A1W896_9ROSI|nr:hypothetical protein CJ030_MR2G024568 [Morella rubra]